MNFDFLGKSRDQQLAEKKKRDEEDMRRRREEEEAAFERLEQSKQNQGSFLNASSNDDLKKSVLDNHA